MSDPREQTDDPALDQTIATNDAVAGEPVIDTGHYGGATGAEPLEAEPEYAETDTEEEIDLDDEEPEALAGGVETREASQEFGETGDVERHATDDLDPDELKGP